MKLFYMRVAQIVFLSLSGGPLNDGAEALRVSPKLSEVNGR